MNGEKARLSASCITSGDKPCILKTDIASLESSNKDTMQPTLFSRFN